ncbi:peroxiredoxin (alkyl hydroperoxide reductase subunit C) [Thermohydrogenium kirishiense]|uniref:peroxiredoxin n=1 Tax=Thermoanaerobacterium thermosaccharolyticum TaxID=1517 RepID=UPI001043CBDD|nr:peroxiredoxin (alkyl hydroperoxide reductase subunit C) [Thermohydrogenium kirishiense]
MSLVGKKAPDFKLDSTKGQISLSDYKGKWVVLFFYPLDFSSVCSTEIPEFNRMKPEFDKLNAELLGINTDSVYSHKAWIESLGGVDFPLLSDYNKEVTKQYGILIEEAGIALRAAFIINPDGIIDYEVVHEPVIGRNVDEILRVLNALQTGHACPVGWKPGDKVLD